MKTEQEISRQAHEALYSHEAIDAAMSRVGQRAFQFHAWTNIKMMIWQDGKIVEIDPNDPDLELPEGFERPPPGPPPKPWLFFL